MKKYLVSLSISATAFFAFAGYTFAQQNTGEELPNVTITASNSITTVDAKLTKAFEQYFKGASNLKWYKVEKKFLVTFIQNDQESRALFTKNGNLVYHIQFGEEKVLPLEIRGLVKSRYFDQKINRVYHVNQNDRSIWVVSLEDPKDYVMVRVEDNELEETQRINKTF